MSTAEANSQQTVPTYGSNVSTPVDNSQPSSPLSNPIDVDDVEEGNSDKGSSWVQQQYMKKLIEGEWKVRRALASAIIMHEYPLSIVEHVGFKNFSASLQPSFKVPCRKTVKNDIMQIYDFEKTKTMSLVENNQSRLAITTNMWTSSKKKGFMAVTSHFIDESWSLQSHILRFIYVPCPHTKEVLSDALMSCLMDWNIDRKISSITVDNCSNNDAMVEILLEKLGSSSLLLGGDLFHMHCCAHILNLIVKDGLDVIKEGVEKIRESVAYWIATPKRQEKFEETARQLRISSTKKLGLDCPTRWSSTYLMLKTTLVYKDVFSRLKQKETQYKSLPTEDEWKFVSEVCERLKLFFSVTELFSGTKYPTANLCFPKICQIRTELSKWLSCGSDVVKSMAKKMFDKFDNYWTAIRGIMGVAVVLDPRYKMELLEFYFQKIYGEMASTEIDSVRQLCYTLFSEYQKKSSLMEDASGESSCQSNLRDSVTLSEYDLFVSRKKSKKANNVKSELDYYLDEDVLPRTAGFDVLTWWKFNRPKYPTLQAIARDILAIPVSTIASESAFSTSGKLVSPHRSKLHPNTLEALMCAQSWLWAAEMKGDSSTGYATIYDDMDSEYSISQME